MSDSDLSYQQRDPAGSYSVRPVTLLVSAGMFALAVIATATGWPLVTNPIAAYFAVLAALLTAAGLAYWSSPLRAPFPRGAFVAVTLVAASTVVLSSVSTWGTSGLIVQQWAPIFVGMEIAQAAPYRPARDLAGATVLAGILSGFVAILHPMSTAGTQPAIVVIVDSAIPLLALGLGATAYASALARSLGRWYSQPRAGSRPTSAELREGVVRSVHEDRVGILNHTVVPFFTQLLQSEVVRETDRDRARAIASSIRSVMVAEVDRSWLDTVVDQVAGERDSEAPGSEVVQDSYRLAQSMTTEQRIVTRAVIVALFNHPGFDPDGFAIVISREGQSAVVLLTAKLDLDDSLPRSGLAAYLAVLRIAFGDLQATFQQPTLRLRFSYDHK
jgi:hypothetical protein